MAVYSFLDKKGMNREQRSGIREQGSGVTGRNREKKLKNAV
jgi:hypothetical protein